MTREVNVIPADASVAQAAEQMRRWRVHGLPVVDRGTVLGMVTDRDITVRVTAAGRDPNTTTVGQIMSTEVISCLEDQEVYEAAQLMADHHVRQVVVLDRDEQLAGIVSLSDIAVEAGDERLSGHLVERISDPAHPKQ